MPHKSSIPFYTKVLPLRHVITAYAKNSSAMWHFEAQLSLVKDFSSTIYTQDSRSDQSGVLVPDTGNATRSTLIQIPSNGVNAYWLEEQNDHGDYETRPKVYAELPVYFEPEVTLRLGQVYYLRVKEWRVDTDPDEDSAWFIQSFMA